MVTRFAAARALANFSHYQATEALMQVLKTERDVALRDRAHESLQTATGKTLPPDPKAWEDLLHQTGDTNVAAESAKNKKLFDWF